VLSLEIISPDVLPRAVEDVLPRAVEDVLPRAVELVVHETEARSS